MRDSKQIIDGLMGGEGAGRMGLFEYIWWDTLEKWVDEGYPTGEDGKPVEPGEHFGYDMAEAGGWFDALPIRGYSEVIEETDQWDIKRNGAGAALKYWKHKSGTPEHIDFLMTSREVWERGYRPHLLKVDPGRVDVEKAAQALERNRARNRWSFMGHLFIWENMRQSMGDYTMYQSLLLDPGWIRDYNRVYTDFFKAHYELLFREAGLPDGVWIYEDLGYRNGLFCSPKVLGELIFPYFAEMVDFFHSHGLPVVLHSCGGVREALPLIVDAGFDGLHPMEVKAGCDVLEFARAYGDRLAFIGGMDARILESGDRAAIRDEIVRITAGIRTIGARYVFASDHSLSTNVAYDDYRFALEIFRENMLY